MEKSAITPEQIKANIKEAFEELKSGGMEGVDYNKVPVIDPTSNVLKLVEQSIVRIDDLNKSEKEHIREIMSLYKELLGLHVSYGEKLSLAESKRIDAIRAVDVGAVAIANERAVGQATVLANQLTASAEILRNLVSSTAATTQTQVINPLIDRIASLEKTQYEKSGLNAVPQDVLNRLILLEKTESAQGGKVQGVKDFRDWIPWLIGIAMFVLYLLKK